MQNELVLKQRTMDKKMLKPAILSISLLTVMASAAISPALNEIKNAFPGISNTDVKLVLTLPSLIMIPFSLLSGWLSSRFSKKRIVLVGLIIYFIFGIGGGLAQSFNQLLVIRACLGVAIGLLMPISSSLIFDYFEGNLRNKMMGLSGSVNQLGGMFFLIIAGLLASYSWKYSFGVYSLSLVSMLFVLLWLPAGNKNEETGTKPKEKVKLNFKIFGIAFIAMMMMVVFFVVSTDLALYIESERPVFSSSEKMFSSQEELQKALEKGEITDYTINSFKNEGIELSKDVQFKEIEKGKEWKFIDINKEYTVKKQGDQLIVYSGIGTSRMAGYALSFMTVPAIIAGFILSLLMKKLKGFIMPFSAMIMAGGYFILSLADTSWIVFVAVGLIGFSGGLLSPPLLLMVPKVLSPNARTLGIAIVSSSILFGQFVSPFFMKMATTIFGNDSYNFKFQFLAYFVFSCAIIALIIMIFSNKKLKKENA
ncbi:MAG TPA: MFS transporter [Bacteroidales bacterium]|nr:MFS transporter [Bacteroidales bacterium]